MLGSQFDDSLQINMMVPEYFEKLRSLIRVASRRWAAVVST